MPFQLAVRNLQKKLYCKQKHSNFEYLLVQYVEFVLFYEKVKYFQKKTFYGFHVKLQDIMLEGILPCFTILKKICQLPRGVWGWWWYPCAPLRHAHPRPPPTASRRLYFIKLTYIFRFFTFLNNRQCHNLSIL